MATEQIKVQRKVTSEEIAAIAPGRTEVFHLPGWVQCQAVRAVAKEVEQATAGARFRITVDVTTDCVVVTRES